MPLLLKVCAVLFAFLYFDTFAFGQAPVQSRGNSANPDLSVNTLFLYRNGSRGNNATDTSPNGFSLDEAELQFMSDVDPYVRANVLLSIHKEAADWKIEPEEAFGESLNLPYVTFKVGKFKAAFGKYNTYHTHALPFIDPQLINKVLLGDEGINDVGVSAAVLIPTTWFSEFTLQVLNGSADPFKATSPNGSLIVARYKNLWDLSDDLTAELGVSGAMGPNDVDKQTRMYGGDLTFKWRPSSGGKYSALVWSTEFISGTKDLLLPGNIVTQGGSTFLQWQMTERWWLQGRTEYLDQLDSTNPIINVQRKQSALVAYLPTEFSGLRLQYDHLEDRFVQSNQAIAGPENRISLQLNLTIGAHPAHSY